MVIYRITVYYPRKHNLRVVFDCGAEYKGVSLNGQLLQGPNLTSSLVGVLMRFRQDCVALMADIKAMFHQVKVAKECGLSAFCVAASR